LEHGTHNAGVEGSSPSLSTSIFSHLRASCRPHDRECGRFAGGEITDAFRARNQVADVGRGVVRRDVRRLVSEQSLAILEGDAGRAQPIPERVLEVMYTDGPKS